MEFDGLIEKNNKQYVEKEYIVTFTSVAKKNEILQHLEIDTSKDDNIDSNAIPDRKILSDIDSKNDSQKRNILLTLENDEVEILYNNKDVISIESVSIMDENWLDVE
tara:strand:+ start:3470 stop:3790 length:321 start_codon:yes stop_codon:yes gene_type:complete